MLKGLLASWVTSVYLSLLSALNRREVNVEHEPGDEGGIERRSLTGVEAC